MLKGILGTNCDVDLMMPWLRRGPVRVPLFFPSPVLFVGAQASRVSVYLSAVTFLSVVFIDFFASLLFGFLDQAGVFVGSSVVVPPVFPLFFFFLSVFTVSICFLLVFFLSLLLLLLLLLNLLRVHSC